MNDCIPPFYEYHEPEVPTNTLIHVYKMNDMGMNERERA
eukprot:COSAG02_NODE_12690_length_1509_cov_1.239716_1_plen_38_part_10